MAFGRLEHRRAAPPMSDINVTPLVDVMLVLVVIFILAAPLLAHSIRLQLPPAQTAQPGAATPSVSVVLDADGQLYVEAQALAPAALAPRLAQLALERPGAEVQLRADARVPYGQVLQVIDAAQAAGLGRIGFVAAPPAPRTGG
ncbi:biopolymer transporter ExbD [Acidovorax sp. HDW3]|jgi:biopolymer transport protein TolR|uniref:ExbD/TolR family protein n=1 Tax=Acidovorax sp. HDW3 TaxID=2714923 RepID=UPI0014089A77|nr:biopolymer transporter ExbD [Acidovorax sp. HDW3]MCE1250605.1 biopolymer transporter ExbD [Comamonadaceae bacterium]QIL42871.1 biopolymer transporter ExbD [Acidovorax sp. HDW3]